MTAGLWFSGLGVLASVLVLFTMTRNLPMGASLRPPEASGDRSIAYPGK